ncbi:NAD(P)H-binding protein [Leucobacter sp. CSA1]|uniref:NAD(P)H-binding protein n=1 Tax=Leucobacter chromiisoli TaxID=2796471 RepID=A0A934Q7U0_9MICO|nr:NAD(P)H-binding protein [Leucobacter chromiisoli]MBK0418254.1 NAD(P)H-binding protein [Leucobacter chromiisoli]
MKIAIAGGTGQAGAQAALAAGERGHEVIVLARSEGIDLVSGSGAAAALDGVDAVIDASGVRPGDDPVAFHEAVVRSLAGAKPPRIVVLSIVNCDRAGDYPLYRGKLAQERAVEGSGVPFTIARTTQFHEFAAQVWRRGARGPLHFSPRMRTRPVAVREVGARLVDLAEAAPVGRAADLGGPCEESLVEMVRGYARASGAGRLVIPINLGGAFGRAQRDGSLLPEPDALRGTETFAEWLVRVAAAAGRRGAGGEDRGRSDEPR